MCWVKVFFEVVVGLMVIKNWFVFGGFLMVLENGEVLMLRVVLVMVVVMIFVKSVMLMFL